MEIGTRVVTTWEEKRGRVSEGEFVQTVRYACRIIDQKQTLELEQVLLHFDQDDQKLWMPADQVEEIAEGVVVTRSSGKWPREDRVRAHARTTHLPIVSSHAVSSHAVSSHAVSSHARTSVVHVQVPWKPLSMHCCLSGERLDEPARVWTCNHASCCNREALTECIRTTRSCPVATCKATNLRVCDVVLDTRLALALRAANVTRTTDFVWVRGWRADVRARPPIPSASPHLVPPDTHTLPGTHMRTP
jgi:hypothetical protein